MILKRNFILSILITVLFMFLCAVYYEQQTGKYTVDGFIHKASHYFKNEQYFHAIRYYKKLISMNVKDERIYTNIAISLLRLGYYDHAINHLSKIENQKTPSSEIYYLLAYSYFLKTKEINKDNNFNTSMRYLKQSIESDPRNKKAYILLGQIFEENKSYENAIKLYKSALSEDMDNSGEFYGLIANTYFKQNNLDEAKNYYLKAIKNNKNYISAYYNIAEIYKKQKDFSKAEEYYKKAIELSPEYLTPYYQIGNLYFSNKDFDNAIEWYKKALKIEPNEEQINFYIGIAYKKQNKLRLAIKHLKTAAYCGSDEAVVELGKIVRNI